MASNVTYMFKKRLEQKQVARQNFYASMSELPPDSELARMLAQMVEIMDKSIHRINKRLKHYD